MSKIQKALAKVQNKRTDAGQDSSDDSRSLTFATHSNGVASDPASRPGKADLVVEIDPEMMRRAGFIAPEYDERLVANQYREIKRPLIAHAFGKKATRVEQGNVILVTSALANEGKTFTSINLAMSMAREKDHTVTLVDGDVINPSITNIFGASGRLGLLDLLDDASIALCDAILPTDVAGLSILPAGRPRHNATEMLASSRMDKLTAEICDSGTGMLVVMDSPPLLQSSEAKVLASVAGQILLVVRAEETQQRVVLNAVGLLGPEKAVNLVLNQVYDADSQYQYGYGYKREPFDQTENSAAGPTNGFWEE